MIYDLDRSLEILLKRELSQQLSNTVTVSFAPPDGSFPPQSVSLPAIDLFLYDIRENTDLRSNERFVERNNGIATIYPAPVRIDCSYLITAWASQSAPNPTEDEHQLIGLTMMALLRYPKLPADVLQGGLANQIPTIATTTLLPGHLQSVGEFWQAMGGKPKVSLNYTVTISVEPAEPMQAPLVLRRDITAQPNVDEGGG